MFNDLISYRGALSKFNENNFDRKLWAYPKKGTAGYNQIQKLRKGESVNPATTIAELTKPQEPIVIEKKKEEKKEEKKKAEKKEKKKAEKKEKKSETSGRKNESAGLKKNVSIKVEPPMSSALLLSLLDNLDALAKKAETSGYYTTADGKAIMDEYKEKQKPLAIYDQKPITIAGELIQWNDQKHPYNMLKKENPAILKRVEENRSDRINTVWTRRMYEEEEAKKEEESKKAEEAKKSPTYQEITDEKGDRYVVGNTKQQMIDALKKDYPTVSKDVIKQMEEWRLREEKDSKIYQQLTPLKEERDKLHDQLQKASGTKEEKPLKKKYDALVAKIAKIASKGHFVNANGDLSM